MSALLVAPPLAPLQRPIGLTEPRPKRLTTEEFYGLADAGLFQNQIVVLLDGRIYEMPVPNPPHVMSVLLTEGVMRSAFSAGYVIRTQQPLPIGQYTDPIPDVAIVQGSPRDFVKHPRNAQLVIEVADTSLAMDLGEKALLYAADGIADYWVVDINARQLHVFRDPLNDAVTGEARYATRTVIDAAGNVTPLAAPGTSIAVADFLP